MLQKPLPRSLLGREACRASIAYIWAEGRTQVSIARAFGYPTSSQICEAIRQFLERYGGLPPISWEANGKFQPMGDDRRAMVTGALVRYYRARGCPWHPAYDPKSSDARIAAAWRPMDDLVLDEEPICVMRLDGELFRVKAKPELDISRYAAWLPLAEAPWCADPVQVDEKV